MTEKRYRIPLAAVGLFVGGTCLAGAIWVVPAMPLEWLKFFPDYTIPALALGLVGFVSLAAAAMVIADPKIGGELSFLAGLMMMTFEVVEAIAVGNLVVRPPVSNAQGDFALWLQVFYFAVGALMAWLGLALWSRAEPSSWSERVRHTFSFEP